MVNKNGNGTKDELITPKQTHNLDATAVSLTVTEDNKQLDPITNTQKTLNNRHSQVK